MSPYAFLAPVCFRGVWVWVWVITYIHQLAFQVDGGVDEGPEEGDADGAEGLDGAVGEPAYWGWMDGCVHAIIHHHPRAS